MAFLLPLFIVSFVTQKIFILMYLLYLVLALMVYVFIPNWRNTLLSQRERHIILCFLLIISRFSFTHWGLWYLHLELVSLFSVRYGHIFMFFSVEDQWPKSTCLKGHFPPNLKSSLYLIASCLMNLHFCLSVTVFLSLKMHYFFNPMNFLTCISE